MVGYHATIRDHSAQGTRGIPPRQPLGAWRCESGGALVLVLVVLVAVAAIAMRDSATSFEMAVDARLLVEEYQADVLAESCLAHALTRLSQDTTPQWDTPADAWAAPLLGDNFRVLILPANSFLNINAVTFDPVMQRAFTTLVPAIPRWEEAVLCLRDWVDGDSFQLLQGGEGPLYDGTRPAIRPPNRPLESVQELGLVHGFHLVRELDADISPGAGSRRLEVDAVSPVQGLRYWSSWVTQAPNINFIPLEALLAYAPELAPRQTAILQRRMEPGIQSAAELQEMLAGSATSATSTTSGAFGQAFTGAFQQQRFQTTSSRFMVEIEVLTENLYDARRYIVDRGNGGVDVIGLERLVTRQATDADSARFAEQPQSMEVVYDARWNNASAF